MRSPSRAVFGARRLTAQRAFSLVEVVLAIGVVSFAMMAMVGVLPVGLRSAQESHSQVAMANIARQLQGELQQISFRSDSTNALTIYSLTNSPLYYTLEGTKTTSSTDGYYLARFDVNNAQVSGSSFSGSNARRVTVTLTYPRSAPEANRQQSVFSLLLAKQKSD